MTQYAALESDRVREFKQVNEEIAGLTRLVAELSLDKAGCRMCCQKSSPVRVLEAGGAPRASVPRLQGAAGLF
jgi:hypothetical protein